jgi:NADH-quinone oxidoreductase subunit N
MTVTSHDFLILFPEISLTILAFVVQMIALSKRITEEMACKIAFAGFAAIIYMVFHLHPLLYGSAFAGAYVQNDYTILSKLLVFVAGVLVIVNYIGYYRSIALEIKSEYVVLMMLSCVGAGVAISARDFIVLFVGLELQSLAAYVLAAFNRDNVKSSEAGLKYFVLGALSSCVMLFGISFLFGFAGSTSDFVVSNIAAMPDINLGLIIGALFLICGLMFKLSIVPFHMWTPDVYEGAPLMSVSFFASMQKLSALVVSITIFAICLKPFAGQFYYFVLVLAILSILVGSIGAVMQSSVKRLMAYSTILNMGYILIPLTIWEERSFEVAMQYGMIYVMSSIALFALFGAALGARAEEVDMQDIEGLGMSKKAASAAITIVMISMIGLPPFAGFFGKYYILNYAFEKQQYMLAAFLLIGTLISAYYYLNIIKAMYFCELKITPSRAKLNPFILLTLVVSLGFVIFYSILPISGFVSFAPIS